MPARNVVKKYAEDNYYHIYNRGVEKREIFIDKQDYETFFRLLERHLSRDKHMDDRGAAYESYAHKLELLAFCLMPNHFHLLFYLNADPTSITELMRKVSGTYTTYFNKKYARVGHLFQGVYKASRITSDSYLLHISRYIHRNPEDYYNWPYSSFGYYIKGWQAEWVRPQRVFDLYDWGTYEQFVSEYQGLDRDLEGLTYELADS